jgi:FlaG/FlaF family flagellin (archaellin)
MSYLPAAIEDIKANITGLNYPSGTTPAEIYKDVYETNNPQDDYGGVQEAIQNQEQPYN